MIMFKEIENEFLSIASNDAMERVTHMPSKTIAKTLDLIYNIKFDDVERVYTEKIPNSGIDRVCVIYKNEDDKKLVGTDLVTIDGKVCHLTLIPTNVLNLGEHNAISLSKAVVTYVSSRINILQSNYESMMNLVPNNILILIFMQSIPILTTSIMKKFYEGPMLPKVVYMTLCELLPVYKKLYSERGIETIIDILNEDVGVDKLLDDGVICSIPAHDKKYPGIWSNDDEEESSIEVTIVDPKEE